MPFSSALSGLQAAANALKVHGNNIANASTPGFKSSRVEFCDVYAAGTLGSSANTIGNGVRLAAVSQQFTRGNIQAAETNLDLAISGSGFFVVDKDGSRLYTRAGGFKVDREGNISNSHGQKLVGFLTDENNVITGKQGPLSITNTNIAPKSTTTVTAPVNLDNKATPRPVKFPSNFNPKTTIPTNSYNTSTQVQIYDTLGNGHMMTMYYVKAPAERTWQVHIGIDGVDVTPQAATPPAGGTPSAPALYPAGSLARPYTLVFDENGKYVINDPATLPSHYGNPPVTSNDITTATYDVGSLPVLNNRDLTINGVAITMDAVADATSTIGREGSAISIASAINNKTDLHKVTATAMPTIFDFTGGTYSTDALVGGDLTINGTQILGSPATANAEGLRDLINGASVPGVAASVVAGELRLTAADGRNIQLETDGAVGATGINFTNFATQGGNTLDKVKRGQIQLDILYDQGITIGGSNPNNFGFNAGTLAGIFQTNSDPISVTFNPGTGATNPQTFTIDLNSSTQFASASGTTALNQDGYPPGRLTGVEVDPSGIITANFGNGKSQKLGQVVLANFRNPGGLQPQGDTAWVATYASGVPLLGAPGTADLGLVQAGSLENSNVQLTNELVALITSQRDFQANAQTVKSADTITQTIINLR